MLVCILLQLNGPRGVGRRKAEVGWRRHEGSSRVLDELTLTRKLLILSITCLLPLGPRAASLKGAPGYYAAKMRLQGAQRLGN